MGNRLGFMSGFRVIAVGVRARPVLCFYLLGLSFVVRFGVGLGLGKSSQS